MNSVAQTLRRHGLRFTDRELRVWLDNFAPRRRRKLAASAPQESSTNAANSPQARRSPAAASRANKVSLVSSNSSSLRSDAPPELFETSTASNGAKPSRRKPKAVPDTAWVEPLLAEARKLQRVAIRDLPADSGRIVFGRYHALKFGGCTANEHTNKLKGLQVAAGLASMARSATYGAMTCGEYAGYARKVHAERNGSPWFDVFLIRAYCEFETGGAA